MTPADQERAGKPEICGACGGRGKRFMLPPGMNAFKMRLPQMGKAMVDTYCFNCNGTGRRAMMEGPKPEEDNRE